MFPKLSPSFATPSIKKSRGWRKGRSDPWSGLKQFEERYQVSSSEFAKRFVAEDLDGQDLEYVEWMGEYRLFQQLDEDLTLLKNVTYVAS